MKKSTDLLIEDLVNSLKALTVTFEQVSLYASIYEFGLLLGNVPFLAYSKIPLIIIFSKGLASLLKTFDFSAQ